MVAWVALIALYFWHLLREKSNVIIERKYHIHEWVKLKQNKEKNRKSVKKSKKRPYMNIYRQTKRIIKYTLINQFDESTYKWQTLNKYMI